MTCITISDSRLYIILRLFIVVVLIFNEIVFGKTESSSVSFLKDVKKERDVCKGENGGICLKSNSYFNQGSSLLNLHHASYANDQLGYEAISQLHSLIDNDNDGDLDRSESREFMEEDLKRDVLSTGMSHYHDNNDLVSVDELWKYWIHSEVYNWTVDEVVRWLESQVELSQYSGNFKSHGITGKQLPRLAYSLNSPLYTTLGIRNVFHRQKITLKSADTVLFGPSRVQHRYFPDTIFFLSLLLAAFSCVIALKQKQHSSQLLKNLNCELSVLQGVQHNLDIFQAQLEESHKKRREEEEARNGLREKLKRRKSIFRIAGFDSDKEDTTDNDERADEDDDDALSNNGKRFVKLRKELKNTMLRLFEAERQLEERRRQSMTAELQQWFQLTYEMETRYWREKKASIENNLNKAIKQCEKLKKQRFKFLSPIKEEPDDGALFAKEMEALRDEMKERTERWSTIERLTSLNIVTNPGIPYLNTLLRSNVADKMSSQSLLSRYSPASSSHLDAYPIKSNLLMAGMQLSAVGVNANKTFAADSTDQQNQFFPSYPLISTYKNHLSSHSSFSSLPRPVYYPSALPDASHPRPLSTPYSSDTSERLMNKGFLHSKTLSDFVRLSHLIGSQDSVHRSSGDLRNRASKLSTPHAADEAASTGKREDGKEDGKEEGKDDGKENGKEDGKEDGKDDGNEEYTALKDVAERAKSAKEVKAFLPPKAKKKNKLRKLFQRSS